MVGGRRVAGTVAAGAAAAALLLVAPAAAAPTAQLTRYPYLTDTFGQYATISFATDRSATVGEVGFGLAGSEACDAHRVTATRTALTVGSVAEYQWTARISGLTGDTAYCYRVFLRPKSQPPLDLLGSDASPTFTTPPAAGSPQPFSFAVLGDLGQVNASGANPDEANVIQQIALSGARFALTTGDNSYPSGTQANYGDLQQVGANLSTIFGPSMWPVAGRSIPLSPAVGNHGLTSSAAQHPQLLNLPQDRAVGLSDGRYVRETYCCLNDTSPETQASAWYAFDVGDARFYVLDATWTDHNIGTGSMFRNDHDAHWIPGTPEYDWLVNDLASHPAQLRFAFFHFPFYADSKTETSDPFIQGPAELEGLLARYGVDIAFNGHAHVYQRNVPNGPHGLVSYVTGGGGATLQPIGPTCSTVDAYGIGWSPTTLKGSRCGSAAAPASAAAVFHFLLVSVNGMSVTVTPTDSLGRTFDVQTYDFTPTDHTPPSPPADLAETASDASSVTLDWTASTDDVGVTRYEVYRVDGAGQTLLGTPVETTFVAGELPCGTTQSFAVDALDAVGNRSGQATLSAATGACPPPDTTAPTDPSGVQQTDGSTTTVTLGWGASSDNRGVAGYEISRLDGDTPTLLGTTTATSFVVTGLTCGTSTTFAVTAFDAAGNRSNAVSAIGTTTTCTVFADDFESGGLSAWTSNVGLVAQQQVVANGAWAARATTTSAAVYAYRTLPTGSTDLYLRIRFNLVSQGPNSVNLVKLRTSGGGYVGGLSLSNTRKLTLRNDVASTTTTSTRTASLAAWHELQLHVVIADIDSQVAVWLDGTAVPDLTLTQPFGSAPIARVQIGDTATGRSFDVAYDDVVASTTYVPGDGAAARALRPTARRRPRMP